MNQQFLAIALTFILIMTFLNGFAGVFAPELVCKANKTTQETDECLNQFNSLGVGFDIIDANDTDTLRTQFGTTTQSSNDWQNLAAIAGGMGTAFIEGTRSILTFSNNFSNLMTMSVAGFGSPELNAIILIFARMLVVMQFFALGALLIVILQAVRPFV